MSLYRWIIAGLWLLFLVYWGIAAAGMKRSVGGPPWIGLRVALILLIIALLQLRWLRRVLAEARRLVGNSDVLGVIGVALCLLGFALAFSARHHLGRNWGPPMSRKEHPELITSGPYAFIRHPIYAGLILAMLGSAIAVSLLWVPLLVLSGAYFIYSARREEALMLRLFPEEYAAYRARTGMLMPRLLHRR
jgi:isoprenylcysteine carboxyl methyltransferase (ICMT) family protein YpbQ